MSRNCFFRKSSGKPYNLEVEGYLPQEEEKKLSITCRYQMNESCIELDIMPYDFHFGRDWSVVNSWWSGEVEWNGQVWKKRFGEDVLRKMGQKVAQRTEMMQVIFHADATLDVFVREVGEENFVQIATLQYDISSMIPNHYELDFYAGTVSLCGNGTDWEPLPCSIFFHRFL